MKILVTGAKGMVGTALVNNLKNIRDNKNRTRPNISVEEIYEYDIDSTKEQLDEYCKEADFVFNLAGVNRPENTEDFMKGNFGFASQLLTLSNIIRDGGRYRLDIIEQKTKKKRTFTVPVELYIYLQSYCLENKIAPDEVIFPISERAIQKHLALVCDYLGPDYGNISTHSFRKYPA